MSDVMMRCFSGSGIHNGYSTVTWGGRGEQSRKQYDEWPLIVSGNMISSFLPVSGYSQQTTSGIYNADRNCYLDRRFDDPTYYTA